MSPVIIRPQLHRTIWYMGAKARVIPGYLARVLDEELKPGDTVVDLMSGSGVVSAFCADRYRVLANDVQLYSALITRSLIEHDTATKAEFLDALDIRKDLGEAYEGNFASLERFYRPALERESELLHEFATSGDHTSPGQTGRRWARAYREFLSDPAGVYPGGEKPSGRSLYRDAASLLTERSVRGRRRAPGKRPSFLVTAFYANVYFGLRQSLQIDSLRAAIEALDGEQLFADKKRVHYLSALLHAASVSTSGTSHFAQPRHLRKDSELRAVARRRLADVFQVFEEYSGEIRGTVERTSHRRGNHAFQSNYTDLIGEEGRFELPGEVDLVYLDPPYTADNYSRFYHVLEVIGRYDYPELQRNRAGEILRGRYPVIDRRFRSGFCRSGRVEDEFRRVIRASAASGAKLVMSYADPTGLLLRKYGGEPGARRPVSRFRDLCRESYRRVRVDRRRMMHSGQGDSNLQIDELLLVCTDPGN